MDVNKDVINIEEFFEMLGEVAIFGTIHAQKEMKVGYLIFEKDHLGVRYKVWVDDMDGEDPKLQIKKYKTDDKEVQ